MRIPSWLAGKEAEDAHLLRFLFDAPMNLALCLAILILSGLAAFFFYRIGLKKLKPGIRRTLIALRVAAVVLVVFLLLRPTLIGFRSDPGRNYVLLLFDNSASMSLSDGGEKSRGRLLQEHYQANAESFESRLRNRFQLAYYGFGDHIKRLGGVDESSFDQPETNHAASLQSALRDFQGIEVSAVILFSDGINQPGEHALPQDWTTPVITVGVGQSANWSDLELVSVNFTRMQGDQRPVAVKAIFSAEGLAGERATLEILDGQKVIASKIMEISSETESHEVRLELKPERKGWLEYTAQVRLETRLGQQRFDQVPENNARVFLVDNREIQYKILYFNGRPNWENKFVRRSLNEDKEIDLTNVIRISAAETKFVYRGKKSSLVNPLFEGFYKNVEDQPRYDESVFLRFGGDAGSAGKGYPEEMAELFEYDLVILGDVEASFFSDDHMEITKEFVRKRGGALLMLGGPHGFSEGDYQGTVLESLLPVLLEKKRNLTDDNDNLTRDFKAAPTVDGLLDGSWALDPNPLKNQELWLDLPSLAGLNLFPVTRPGATILALAETEESDGGETPLFAVQRYGEGKSAIMATGATWLWHMKTKQDDGRHARFWRQMVRSLAHDAAKPIFLRNKRDSYVRGREASLEALVRDRLFDEQTGLRSRWTLTSPLGEESLLPVDESLGEAGLYTGKFRAEEPGVYRMGLSMYNEEGAQIGAIDEALLVEPDIREYRSAAYRPEYLKRLADQTGGRFFPLDKLSEIPEQLPGLMQTRAEELRFPIWHFPGFFALLFLLLATEWYLRRTRGQA